MDNAKSGWLNGFIGVLIFSGSLPATKVAVQEIDPLFLTFLRAVFASLLAIAFLYFFKAIKPKQADLKSLAITSLGVVVGFPIFTALALEHVTSAHAIVFIGLLPLLTALFGVLRAGDTPKPAFWFFSVLGSLFVVAFAFTQDVGAAWQGNIYMTLAIITCGFGYAEGGKLSRTLGGWQVISWALVLSLPIMVPITLYLAPPNIAAFTAALSTPVISSVFYVSAFSMFLGFVFWNRGLAIGGVARISQLQLLQPFFGLMLAALLLGESISWQMSLACVAVVLCVAGTKKYS
ncbi:MAG: DMT family transporter [Nitratireductor sp.]